MRNRNPTTCIQKYQNDVTRTRHHWRQDNFELK